MGAIAFVIGGGAAVHSEYAQARELCRGHAVTCFAVNDQIAVWDSPVVHGVSLHPAKLVHWLAQRRAASLPALQEVWSWQLAALDGVTRQIDDWGGSSGLLAVRAAMASGFDRVVLCGVPMDCDAGHFVRQRRWPHAIGFRKGWLAHRGELAPVVRSCSGWTLETFGALTPGWIDAREIGVRSKVTG